jgi:hypothetical protein
VLCFNNTYSWTGCTCRRLSACLTLPKFCVRARCECCVLHMTIPVLCSFCVDHLPAYTHAHAHTTLSLFLSLSLPLARSLVRCYSLISIFNSLLESIKALSKHIIKHKHKHKHTHTIHPSTCLSHTHTNFLSRALLLPFSSHSSMESRVLRAACSVQLRSHPQQHDPQQQVNTVNRLRDTGAGRRRTPLDTMHNLRLLVLVVLAACWYYYN